MGLRSGSVIKNPPANAGDVRNVGLISLVREVPLEKGVATHPGITDLKFSMNTGAWRATVCEVTKSWTWLSTHATLHYSCQPGTLGSSCWGASRWERHQHLVEVIRADRPAKAALQRLEIWSALWPAPPLLLESCEHPVVQPVLTCCDDRHWAGPGPALLPWVICQILVIWLRLS